MSGYRRNRSVKTFASDVLPEVFTRSLVACKKEKTSEKSTNKFKDKLYDKPVTNKNSLERDFGVHSMNQSSPPDSGSSLIIRLSGLSSTSSLSWSDEYENEITKKVQDQLEKLDRIFMGVEEIPSNYYKAEIEEWVNLFPNLCILGTKTPLNSPSHSEYDSDSVIECCDTMYKDCKDNHILLGECLPLNKKLTRNINMPIKNEESLHAKGRGLIKHKHSFTPRKVQSFELDKYLKISPIRSSKKYECKRIAPLLVDKQLVSCEADLDNSSDYASLPFINTNTTTYSSKSCSKNSGNLTLSKKKLENIVLPPIANQFRSISATPRHSVSSSFSVFGTNLKQQKRRQLISFLENVPISNR